MADSSAIAVVVVSANGKLRFRDIGIPSATNESFNPVGITTDSQSRILTVEGNTKIMYNLDQLGHFLCYLNNCGLQCPWGLWGIRR